MGCPCNCRSPGRLECQAMTAVPQQLLPTHCECCTLRIDFFGRHDQRSTCARRDQHSRQLQRLHAPSCLCRSDAGACALPSTIARRYPRRMWPWSWAPGGEARRQPHESAVIRRSGGASPMRLDYWTLHSTWAITALQCSLHSLRCGAAAARRRGIAVHVMTRKARRWQARFPPGHSTLPAKMEASGGRARKLTYL